MHITNRGGNMEEENKQSQAVDPETGVGDVTETTETVTSAAPPEADIPEAVAVSDARRVTVQ